MTVALWEIEILLSMRTTKIHLPTGVDGISITLFIAASNSLDARTVIAGAGGFGILINCERTAAICASARDIVSSTVSTGNSS